MKGQKKKLHTNGNQKRARIAIFMSDNIDYNPKTLKRDKGGNYK